MKRQYHTGLISNGYWYAEGSRRAWVCTDEGETTAALEKLPNGTVRLWENYWGQGGCEFRPTAKVYPGPISAFRAIISGEF